MTGPGATAVTSTFTPKSASFCTNNFDNSCNRSGEKPPSLFFSGLCSKPMDGRGCCPSYSLPCKSRRARSLVPQFLFSSGSIGISLVNSAAGAADLALAFGFEAVGAGSLLNHGSLSKVYYDQNLVLAARQASVLVKLTHHVMIM